MRRYLGPFVMLLLLLPASEGFAASCNATFSNAVGTIGGELKLSDDVELENTGDRELATANLIGSGSFCDGQRCIEGGTHADRIALPTNNSNREIDDRSFDLPPGDYYVKKLTFKEENTLTISGSGQVRIHIAESLVIDEEARINVSGDALDLVFLVAGTVDIKDEARVHAVIYAEDQLKVEGEARVEGAVVGSGSEIKDEARIDFVSTDALAIDGVCEADPGGPIGAGPLNFRVEVGALTVIDTYQKPEFTRVNFTQVFEDPPLVFTLPTIDGSHAAAHRIRNITVDGFDIMTLEPPPEDGEHISMSLNFLAVEEGVHDLGDGRKIVAAKRETRRVQAYQNAGGGIGWEDISFGGVFSVPPAVLGQIQTMTNEVAAIPSEPSTPWLTTAIRNVTSGGMQIALERSESLNGSVNQNETIAYLAVEPVDRWEFLDSGGSTIQMEVIRTDELLQGWNTCNASANRIYFSAPWDSPPIVLATKNTRDGDTGVGDGEGGWLRRCSTSMTETRLQVDEVRQGSVGDRNRNHTVRERAGLVMFSDNFVTEWRDLDHFRLLHDGLGIIGAPETVTIQACRDAACSQLYTGSVTATLQPGNATTSWSGPGVLANQVTFTGGSRTVELNRTVGGTFDIGLTATPTPANGTRCFIDSDEDCSTTFIVPAFTVNLPDQVSGDTAVGSLALSDCWSEFQSKTIGLDVAAQYVSPASVGPAVRVNHTALPTDGSSSPVDFDFDDTCTAPVTVDYADAGEIGLDFQYIGTGPLTGLTISGNDNLVFYPAALMIEALNGSGIALDADAADATPTHTAAAAFRLRVTAVNSSGALTTAYQPQAADRLLVYAERTGPDPGVEGVFEVSPGTNVSTHGSPPAGPGDYQVSGIETGDFTDGLFQYDAARYSEVGLVMFYALDTDYMGYPIAATPVPIGRFVPSHFQVSGSVSNRYSTTGCSGDNFTYLNEPLRLTVTLTAVNAQNNVTANYRGLHASIDGGGFGRFGSGMPNTLGIRSAANLSDRLTIRGVSAGAWAGGSLDLDFDIEIGRIALPDGPHNGSEIGIAHVGDDDGIALEPFDRDIDGVGGADHVYVADVNLRYGRLAVGNAHGSERRDLDIPVQMQVFGGAGVGFVTHGDDDCTLLQAVALSDAAGGGALPAATCVIDDSGGSGVFACASGTSGNQYDGEAEGGDYAVSLKAPGAGDTGAVHVTAQTLSSPMNWQVDQDWARFDWTGAGSSDPQGLATFGIYNRTSGIIYQRELR